MALLRLNCRVCAKLGVSMQKHAIVPEFKNLALNEYCVQCLGCGDIRTEILLKMQVPTDEDMLND